MRRNSIRTCGLQHAKDFSAHWADSRTVRSNMIFGRSEVSAARRQALVRISTSCKTGPLPPHPKRLSGPASSTNQLRSFESVVWTTGLDWLLPFGFDGRMSAHAETGRSGLAGPTDRSTSRLDVRVTSNGRRSTCSTIGGPWLLAKSANSRNRPVAALRPPLKWTFGPTNVFRLAQRAWRYDRGVASVQSRLLSL